MSVDSPDRSAHAANLLDWYDAHARLLPWRSPPHQPPADAYRVWLSEIMLQQTTVATVIAYFNRFVATWPDVQALAAAPDAAVMQAWAGLGYYARARNLLACARAVVAQHGGVFPADEATLRRLPGIGAYTTAAIAAIAFERPATVVDGNVERVIARLFGEAAALPAAKSQLYAHAAALTPQQRAGDYAQAMMDLGATLCTPRQPACGRCPVQSGCVAQAGDPTQYPAKPIKPARPVRLGQVYWLESDGKVALVRRPPRGLLGGMLALPTDDWTIIAPPFRPPVTADWHVLPGGVRHVFTHFELQLTVAFASVSQHGHDNGSGAFHWHTIADIEGAGLPTVFVKAARHVLANRSAHAPVVRQRLEGF